MRCCCRVWWRLILIAIHSFIRWSSQRTNRFGVKWVVRKMQKMSAVTLTVAAFTVLQWAHARISRSIELAKLQFAEKSGICGISVTKSVPPHLNVLFQSVESRWSVPTTEEAIMWSNQRSSVFRTYGYGVCTYYTYYTYIYYVYLVVTELSETRFTQIRS